MVTDALAPCVARTSASMNDIDYVDWQWQWKGIYCQVKHKWMEYNTHSWYDIHRSNDTFIKHLQIKVIHRYSCNIHKSKGYIYITLQIKMIHAYDIHRSQWKTHTTFIDPNDTHFLKYFTSLFGKEGWKPELICPNIMLWHPDSKVIVAAAQPLSAPPGAVILTAPVTLAMAKSPPPWLSVWVNKSFVRGAVNRKKGKFLSYFRKDFNYPCIA